MQWLQPVIEAPEPSQVGVNARASSPAAQVQPQHPPQDVCFISSVFNCAASPACLAQGTRHPLACLQPNSRASQAGGSLPRAASPSHPTAWDPSNTKLISNHG